ncbi:methylated-DNA--[protein]-cysteine S-methyltransferase [Limosilactobacillus allomucosae]|uniref:Methylated-DNA--[protein]-cysteine S-methyltransferase n=1 Tax=Limosilactobacillus allomucosae TaxID=3142938 RepID=A0ABV0I6G2_9LACO
MKKTIYDSPLGKMTILADDRYLYGLWFNDQKYYGGHYNLDKIESGLTSQASKTIDWLNQFFAGQNPSYNKLKLKEQATEFQLRVYNALQKIPYGHTVTYKELSDAIQEGHAVKKNLSRAVGNAIGHNQILLIVPCHRVIGSNGSLTGYAGGLERKKALLRLERKSSNESSK